MIYVQPWIRTWKWDAQNSLEFWNIDGSSDLSEPTRQSDSPQPPQKKKRGTCRIIDYAVSADKQSKTEGKRKERLVPRPCWSIEKTVEHERDDNTNCNWHARYSLQRTGKNTGRRIEAIQIMVLLRSNRILKKCPQDLRRFAITQTWVEDHPLTLVWKTLKGVK